MTQKTYDNVVIEQRVDTPDIVTGVSMGTWQEDYPLREVEFHHIKDGKSITLNWANGILLTSIGFGLNLIAKGYSDATSITAGEWIAFSVGILVSIILYVAGYYLPNKRKQVMKNIEGHFEGSPMKRQGFKGGYND